MRRVPAVIAALAFVVALPTLASAQSLSNLTGGVKGGLSFGDIPKVSQDFDDSGLDVGMRTGFIIGGFVTAPFSDYFGLQVEGLYTQKGFDGEDLNDSFGFHFDYIDIPVLLRLETSRTGGFYALVGPSFNFLVTAKAVAENLEDVDIKDDTETFEMALVFAAGFRHKMFGIEGRYMEGLTNIAKTPDLGPDVDSKTRTFAILASLRFK